ncbi:MAG: SDR family NAD(P)-dependent oxidoreductase [Planctomycetota bacterium]|nr:SDR family NAD(P)-dependent oxidoreductase [Planctomycetota bacterium]
MSHQKTVCITGASGGIGQALAREFHGRGNHVILVGRNLEKLKAFQDSLGGERTSCLELDLTQPDAIEPALAGQAVDVLVNNAGVAISSPLLKGGDLYRKHLDVNFHGPRLMIEAVLPGMIERGGGAIIQIASSAALEGYAYTSAYAASKHALLGYTRSAALEVGKKGIRFQTICPHFVDSPMTDESVARIQETTGISEEDARERLASMNPDGQLVDPKQIATVAADGLQSQSAHVLWELTGRRVTELGSTGS